MSELTRNFVKAALMYLVIGTTIGVIMGIGYSQGWGGTLRATHAHINLLGWTSMLMFGVAYHIIPRFHGKMLYSDKLSIVHFWMANAGLIGLGVFLYWPSDIGLGIFGSIWAMSAYIFAYNMLKTMAGGPKMPPGMPK